MTATLTTGHVYDPETGVIYRLGTNIPMSTQNNGYPRIGQKSAAHVVWESLRGPLGPHERLVHINGDRADIRISNLSLTARRTRTRRINAQDPEDKNPYPGITWDAPRKMWRGCVHEHKGHNRRYGKPVRIMRHTKLAVVYRWLYNTKIQMQGIKSVEGLTNPNDMETSAHESQAAT